MSEPRMVPPEYDGIVGTTNMALALLPATCRYHGTNIDPPDDWYLGRDACCDTGEASVRRRDAVAAMKQLVDLGRGAAELSEQREAVLALHKPVEVHVYDDTNGVFVYGKDGEVVVLARLCGECSLESTLEAVGDCEWSEDLEGNVRYPCPTACALGVTECSPGHPPDDAEDAGRRTRAPFFKGVMYALPCDYELDYWHPDEQPACDVCGDSGWAGVVVPDPDPVTVIADMRCPYGCPEPYTPQQELLDDMRRGK